MTLSTSVLSYPGGTLKFAMCAHVHPLGCFCLNQNHDYRLKESILRAIKGWFLFLLQIKFCLQVIFRQGPDQKAKLPLTHNFYTHSVSLSRPQKALILKFPYLDRSSPEPPPLPPP